MATSEAHEADAVAWLNVAVDHKDGFDHLGYGHLTPTDIIAMAQVHASLALVTFMREHS